MSKRIDQDINFNLGDMTCIMRADMDRWFVDSLDRWVIRPRDPQFVRRRDGRREFRGRIAHALEQLAGMWGGRRVRTPRQCYSWQVHENYAEIIVSGKGVFSIARGIDLSDDPEIWDGQSLNFFGSQQLARLLADWRDADSDIQFVRSDGSLIEYEQYIEKGGNPFGDEFDAWDASIEPHKD